MVEDGSGLPKDDVNSGLTSVTEKRSLSLPADATVAPVAQGNGEVKGTVLNGNRTTWDESAVQIPLGPAEMDHWDADPLDYYIPARRFRR